MYLRKEMRAAIRMERKGSEEIGADNICFGVQ